ncbi:MAG: hypothetical protein J7647_29485 [Cyanobacteria bacterium SBLK]|nr:hypothetical protein [Cyanobacteria bacterium SBLK]
MQIKLGFPIDVREKICRDILMLPTRSLLIGIDVIMEKSSAIESRSPKKSVVKLLYPLLRQMLKMFEFFMRTREMQVLS